nr:hypothetical protein [uncultured Rhodoferax sp.]
MGTPAKVAIAVLTVAVLGLFGCVPGPGYFITRASCASGTLSFGHQSLDGVDGFTDYSASISEETAIKMLAERRVKFIEQKKLDKYSPLPLGLLVNVEKDSFAKLWIDKVGSRSCITNNQHMHFGVTYDLYSQGMKPSECLAGAVVTQPAGRYLLEAHHKKLLGSSSVEYEMRDGLNGSKVASIQSAQVWTSAGEDKTWFMARTFVIGCYANQQSVANIFQARSGHESPLPTVRDVDTTRPLSGTIRFVRTQMSKDEFLKISSNTTHHDIKLASKWQSKRTVAVADGRFISNFEFSNETPPPLSAADGVVLPRSNQVSFVWLTGEVQNLDVNVDEGKFISTDGFKVVGNRLLFFAVTDWAKGWAVFEASLGDFDINVAKRVMAENAKADESTKTRFVVQDDGLVLDMQTGLIWAQADSGVHTAVDYAFSMCKRRGANWSLPSAAQLSGLFLTSGSIRAKCGAQPCYVSPAFKLSSSHHWSRNVDDAGIPVMMNFGSGSLEANKYPKTPDIAPALCVRSN